MKKILLMTICFLVAISISASASPIGAGIQVGLDFPLIQDDQAEGMIFGLKATWPLAGILALEPNLTFTKFGDPELSDYPSVLDGLEGSKMNYFGINALLGSGFGTRGVHPYFMAGAGFYSMKRDQTEQDISELGFNAGLGLELGVANNIAADGRVRLNILPMEDGGSKKSVSATVGLTMYFGN